MPRPSKLPFHLLQSVHVPKEHPLLAMAGKRWQSALEKIGERYGATWGELERKTTARRKRFYSFRVMDPKYFTGYVTFTAPRGVQVISARLKPKYENMLLKSARRSRDGTIVFSRGKFRVRVTPRTSDRSVDVGPVVTPYDLIETFGRARVRVL